MLKHLENMLKSERQLNSAVYHMTEYLLSDAGRQHLYDLHVGATERDYYEVFYQLYELDEKEDFEALSSGATDTAYNQCSMVS